MNKRCIVGEILLEDGFLQRRRRLCQMLDNGRYIGHYKDEQEINIEDLIDNAPGFSILIKAQECCWKEKKQKISRVGSGYNDVMFDGSGLTCESHLSCLPRWLHQS